jgi:uncharacterized membrane protein
MNQKMVYGVVLVLSVLFLFAGNRLVSEDIEPVGFVGGTYFYSAVVTEIISDYVREDWGGVAEIIFEARITDGDRNGETVRGYQRIPAAHIVVERPVSPGNRVILFYQYWEGVYNFIEYVRFNFVIVLAIVFLVLVLLFARSKGFNAIVALGLTCAAIFWVFLPAIMAGRNIYVTTLIVCVYAVVTTLLLVVGANKKAYSAMLGCLGGVAFAGILMLASDALLHLTGFLDMEMTGLIFLENPPDLRAIIFAGVILGAVGAIMDVAMSISSSLWELKEAGGISDFSGIFKSGITIGKDILGTMLNTLILAYLGSSLSLILLITAHHPVPLILLNQ